MGGAAALQVRFDVTSFFDMMIDSIGHK